MASPMVCPTCSCDDIEHNETTGEAVCTNCGTVLEENTIVSSIEFQESASGSASVIGSFVSSTSTKAFGTMGASGRHFSKDGRETTLRNGKRRIVEIAGTLRLGQHYIDSAHRLFRMGVQRNFTMGRKTMNVVAVCLYVVCRREKSPHLLIDFSDKLQTNVFILGSIFLKFCKLLNLSLPIIDPSLYIHRFASQLGFAEKTHTVATTALRLVATMKRDWMEAGRRPSGICGAALLIAARSHNIKCSRMEVASVVQVCDETVRKRLFEFSETPSAQLTSEQFGRIMLDTECDPPSFRRHREKERIQALMKAKTLENMKCIEAASSVVHKDKTGNTSSDEDESFGFQDEDQMVASKASRTAAKQLELQFAKTSRSTISRARTAKEVYETIQQDLFNSIQADIKSLYRKQTSPEEQPEEELCGDLTENVANKSESSISEKRVVFKANEDETLSDMDDEEIDALLLMEHEVEKKTELWMELNKVYLKQQEEKAAHEAATGGKPAVRKRRKRSNSTDTPKAAIGTVDHTISKLKNKRVSKKINYEVLHELFGPQ